MEQSRGPSIGESTDAYRLVLVRHAKSDYPWGVDDHDRPLSERGRRDAPELGAWLDAHLTWTDRPPVILVSSARRAQLTWGLASARLSPRWDAAAVSTEPRIYEASSAGLRALVAEAVPSTQTLILVGHNPGLVDLVADVCVVDDLYARATAKFPTSAVAMLHASVPLGQAVDAACFRVEEFAVPRG